MPSALLSRILLTQDPRQKQVVIRHRGRSLRKFQEYTSPRVTMNMKNQTIAVMISLLFSLPLFAGELIKPESILGKQELCISDGSSIYIFAPDKTFLLEPLGKSGRTIKGTWTSDSYGIHIVGQWTWINGFSANDDFREMDIHIGSLQDTTRDQTSMLTASKHKIYECYFLIDRVEKKKKSEQDGGGQPATRSESK